MARKPRQVISDGRTFEVCVFGIFQKETFKHSAFRSGTGKTFSLGGRCDAHARRRRRRPGGGGGQEEGQEEARSAATQ